MREATIDGPSNREAGRYPDLVQTLEQSYAELEQSLAGLDDTICSLKVTPESWSIAEVIEHLATLEKRVTPRLAEKLSPAEPSLLSPADQEKENAALVEAVISRTCKVPAPDVVRPTGRYKSYREALADLRAARQRTLAYVKVTSQDLKAVSMPHPILGPLDGY